MKKRILYNVTKQIAPNWGKRLYHAARGWVNRRRSTADVFSAIYSVRHWGIQGEFDSGVGTADDGVTGPYLRVLFEQIERLGVTGADFVDLGCGDFKVGAQVAALAGSYVGVDVVPDLVKFLNGKYGSAKLSFRCMNMVEDELPAGEVCFIRQVLQHLSNEQILQILPKLRAYKHIFITEHVPNRTQPYKPNVDKAQGPDIRLYWHSGVFLDQAPFSIPAGQLREILSVPGTPIWKGEDPGEIVTWLYTPV